MPLILPHCPFQVEEPYFSMYVRVNMPPPSTKDDKTGYEPCHMAANRERYGTDSAIRELGCVVARTKEPGHWDSTVAMFFTDHGEYLGEHFPVLRAALLWCRSPREFAFSEGGFLLSEGPLLEQAPYPYIEAALQHEDTALGQGVNVCTGWTSSLSCIAGRAILMSYIALRRYLSTPSSWLRDSDFLPYHKDPRFPKLDLESPKSQ
ncbi:hypothetical protein N8I77_007271 [Diaporthe amygdali]|uniref:Sulfatase N-terminal domain-containing protein n=1 Tax=Phomopsis amygdali TaxID=1214568 RepID=A0AAD9W1Q3_PHOAM|nr:hypothetical protein N8I77_007271 [Diaporthe amygdali]